jgi:hypothetical protein|tara:strand:- start:107 stop:763 length:657 start_codon:yes stop_codon:yes gene_type:complete
MVNYTYLVNDIIQASENEGTEFVNYVPNMVNRAEERLTKDLDDYGLVSYTSVAVSSGNNILTLPTGTRIVKNINIVSNSTKINLLQRTDEYINDYWPVSASTDEPRYYAPRNNSTVLIAPTPASTYSGQVVHVSRPVTLTSATPENYYTDFCYDLLFNASMIEAMVFQKDYPTSQLFEQRYSQLLELQRNQARRTRRDDMQSPTSPAGADDNLVANTN